MSDSSIWSAGVFTTKQLAEFLGLKPNPRVGRAIVLRLGLPYVMWGRHMRVPRKALYQALEKGMVIPEISEDDLGEDEVA